MRVTVATHLSSASDIASGLNSKNRELLGISAKLLSLALI